ncbi:hypothetical protein FGO68_gene3312 [Halteria grandinella]|uniref:Uncharacterized protein n=1 Tax=Halteria grandinella TaxID=5974 RepID=A0A8J8SW54_HALGN|nr:hypothetical protein FGO68_gene3312 [Halteria grandinella]
MTAQTSPTRQLGRHHRYNQSMELRKQKLSNIHEDDQRSNIDLQSLKCSSIKAPTKSLFTYNTSNRSQQSQPVTRRNITLAKITNNILQHNNPAEPTNFSSLFITANNHSAHFPSRGYQSLGSSLSHIRPVSGLLGMVSQGQQLQSKELLGNGSEITRSKVVFKKAGQYPGTSQSHQRPHNLLIASKNNGAVSQTGTNSTRIIMSTHQNSERYIMY